MSPLQQAVIAMCNRAGGFRPDEMPGESRARVGMACQRLVTKGLIVKHVVGHKHTRYFSREYDRDQYAAQLARRVVVEHRVAHGPAAPWPADAPVVTPAHIVVQVCPGYQPRFTERTFPFVHG